MHIVVCMKQVVDLQQLRIRRDTREPVLEGLPVKFGDFDKNALEAGVRLKEAAIADKLTVVASGTTKLKDTVKEALAMGADQAVVLTDAGFAGADASGSARLLAAAIRRLEDVALVLAGEGSDDEYSGQVPGWLSGLLGFPLLTYARELTVHGGRVRAVQDYERELIVGEADLPAVVGVTSELNEPRLPALTAILRAASKPILEWGPSELQLGAAEVGAESARVKEVSNLAPEQDRKRVIYEDAQEGVAEILKALRHEGVLD